jgi:hypothetical protein
MLAVLLSSHRDYDAEKDWELLRNDSPYGDALVFEPQIERSPTGTQRYEMIVTNRWASKVRSSSSSWVMRTGKDSADRTVDEDKSR